MASKWQALSLANRGLPPLFLKANLNLEGYTIYVTDLGRVWGEKLSKRQIQRRAEEIKCTIDPGEGDDQLQILLEKIEEALQQQGAAMICLRYSHKGHGSLILCITAPLPSPLPELKWNVYLNLLPAHHVRAKLVLPLALQVQRLQSQVEALVHQLREKDRVMSKITDRLEQTGNDLTICFPGLSNLRVTRVNSQQSQREQLAKYVSGLGNFNEEEWRVTQAKATEQERIESAALEVIMRNLPATLIGAEDFKERDVWWCQTKDSSSGISPTESPRQINQDANLSQTDCLSGAYQEFRKGSPQGEISISGFGEGENDFQRRDAPVHLRTDRTSRRETENKTSPSSNNRHGVIHDDKSTEDEDDDWTNLPPIGRSNGDFETSSSDIHATSVPQRAEKSTKDGTPASHRLAPKLGIIGGKTKQKQKPEPGYNAVAEPNKSSSIMGGEIRSNSASQHLDPSPYNLSVTKGPAINKEPTVEHECISADTEQAAGRSEKTASPQREETSIERTERKRKELKRQIEEKAKTPSKRKKRKF